MYKSNDGPYMDKPAEQKLLISTTDLGIMLVLLAALFSGLRPLFGRWLLADGVTAVVTALYSFMASAMVFLPGGLRDLQTAPRSRRVALLGVGCGLFTGLGSAAYFEALQRLPVATVTLIFFTYPAMVISVMAVLRRHWPQPPALAAIACVLVGCSLIVGPKLQATDGVMIDFAIAFMAPLSWTLLLVLLDGPLTRLSPWSRIGFVTTGGVLAMIIVAIIWRPPVLIPRTIDGYLGVLGLVTISGISQHILITLGIQKAGSERASIAGVFEVATALAVGWLVFLEPVTFNQGVGIILIGAALLLTRRLKVDITAPI